MSKSEMNSFYIKGIFTGVIACALTFLVIWELFGTEYIKEACQKNIYVLVSNKEVGE